MSAHDELAGPDSGPANDVSDRPTTGTLPNTTVLPSTTVLPNATVLPNTTEIWLIRHGETEWSRDGRHTSRTDLPLTPLGEREAEALRPMLADVHPALVLSSPRLRALRTAEIAGLRVDGIDDDLREWDYGEYEGMTSNEIRKNVPGWTIWTHPVPGGETAADVTARADRVLDKARANVNDGPVILLAHGHICRVLGARWIELRAEDGGRLAFDTASPSILAAEHGRPVIGRWNVPNPAVVDQRRERTSR